MANTNTTHYDIIDRAFPNAQWSDMHGTYTPNTNIVALCPDLLDIRSIGVADNWRGHVVRSFFVVMSKLWPVPQ